MSIWSGPASGSRRRGRALAPEGSLFLNVGAKPKDPWTALDVAQAVRPHLELQNIIHWVKSIAIEKALAGTRSGLADDLAVGHYKPINSRRFLNDCHEFVFHFSPQGHDAARPHRRRREVPGRVERDPLAEGRGRPALPRQHLVPALRHHPEPRQGAAASGHVPVAAAGVLPEAARPRSHQARGRSVPRDWAVPPSPARSWGSTSSASSSTSTI